MDLKMRKDVSVAVVFSYVSESKVTVNACLEIAHGSPGNGKRVIATGSRFGFFTSLK